jgi:hypothetical protein
MKETVTLDYALNYGAIQSRHSGTASRLFILM